MKSQLFFPVSVMWNVAVLSVCLITLCLFAVLFCWPSAFLGPFRSGPEMVEGNYGVSVDGALWSMCFHSVISSSDKSAVLLPFTSIRAVL